MRALVVSNMAASPDAPGRGSFVRDQVTALRALGGVDLEIELMEFAPGGRHYAAAGARLAQDRRRGRRYDVVHAHFGLTQWPALAARTKTRAVTLHGTDLRHPRSRRLTTAALSQMDLIATVSPALAELVPARIQARAQMAVLPCGVNLERFRPLPRRLARLELGLDPAGRYLLFPADPARREKRHDLASDAAADTELLTLGAVDPAAVPLWINAANAVLVPSDAEGFGLAVLEALACEVPVLATPVGIHPRALEGLAGTLCAPYDRRRWRQALGEALRDPDPRVPGRARAAEFSAELMAERVVAAWRGLTD